jgi:hypothetical protein
MFPEESAKPKKRKKRNNLFYNTETSGQAYPNIGNKFWKKSGAQEK